MRYRTAAAPDPPPLGRARRTDPVYRAAHRAPSLEEGFV